MLSANVFLPVSCSACVRPCAFDRAKWRRRAAMTTSSTSGGCARRRPRTSWCVLCEDIHVAVYCNDACVLLMLCVLIITAVTEPPGSSEPRGEPRVRPVGAESDRGLESRVHQGVRPRGRQGEPYAQGPHVDVHGARLPPVRGLRRVRLARHDRESVGSAHEELHADVQGPQDRGYDRVLHARRPVAHVRWTRRHDPHLGPHGRQAPARVLGPRRRDHEYVATVCLYT